MSGFYEEVNAHPGETFRTILDTGTTSADQDTVIRAVVGDTVATARLLEPYNLGWVEVSVPAVDTADWVGKTTRKMVVKFTFSDGEIAITEHVKVKVVEEEV